MTDRAMRLSRLGRHTALLVMLRAAVVAAHPGVFHDIERISKEIEKKPNRVVLLIDRGMYYRMACEFALSAVRTDWLLRSADALVSAGQPSEAESDRARALEEADRALAKRQSATLQMARTRVLVSMGKRGSAECSRSRSQDVAAYVGGSGLARRIGQTHQSHRGISNYREAG